MKPIHLYFKYSDALVIQFEGFSTDREDGDEIAEFFTEAGKVKVMFGGAGFKIQLEPLLDKPAADLL